MASHPRPARLWEFHNVLGDCKYRQDKNGPEFYSPSKVTAWMNKRDKRDNDKSNAEILLEEVPDRVVPKFLEPISDERRSYVLVLGILIIQTQARLVHLFQRANISDQDLVTPDFQRLKRTLEQYVDTIVDIDGIISEFKLHRWKFCAARLELQMDEIFQDDRILPFRETQDVNGKGGTALVRLVTVPAGFISKELREQLEQDPSQKDSQVSKRSLQV
jgi:hypothetical protein